MKKILFALAITAFALVACNKDDAITDSLKLGKEVYEVGLSGAVYEDGTFSCDIHFGDKAPMLEGGWPLGVIVCEGKLGSATLPSEDFVWDYIPFKSGKVKSWAKGDHLYITAEGVLENGQSFKLSAQSEEF